MQGDTTTLSIVSRFYEVELLAPLCSTGLNSELDWLSTKTRQPGLLCYFAIHNGCEVANLYLLFPSFLRKTKPLELLCFMSSPTLFIQTLMSYQTE